MKTAHPGLIQVCYILHIEIVAFGANIGKSIFLAILVPIFSLASIEGGLEQDIYIY